MATQLFPSMTFPVGTVGSPSTQMSPAVAIASGVNQLDLTCGCTSFTNTAITVTFGLQISYDNGATFVAGPSQTQTPPIKNRDGTTATQIRMLATLGDPSQINNPNRRVRGFLTAFATDGTTSVTLGPGSITLS
jgi:hypothetical protein